MGDLGKFRNDVRSCKSVISIVKVRGQRRQLLHPGVFLGLIEKLI